MKNTLVYIAVIAILLIGGFYAFNAFIYHEKQGNDSEMCIQVLTDARNPDTGKVETFPTPCDVPEGWEVIDGSGSTFQRGDETLRAYESSTGSLRFEFRVEPDGYTLVQQDISQIPDNTVTEHVTIFDTSEYLELMTSSAPREGPPAISVLVFTNTDNQTPREWVQAHSMVSNIQLAQSDIQEVEVAGAQAVRYSADGLYMSDNVVVASGNHIYMFSGAYASVDATIRDDFEELLASVSLN